MGNLPKVIELVETIPLLAGISATARFQAHEASKDANELRIIGRQTTWGGVGYIWGRHMLIIEVPVQTLPRPHVLDRHEACKSSQVNEVAWQNLSLRRIVLKACFSSFTSTNEN
jgi:hypothetical protein